jgi:protein-tyrosine phosphatase
MTDVFQRHIDISGLINFRDLGQYPALDIKGQWRKVKSGVLFRAGHFFEAGNEAQKTLMDLHILHLVDFRSESERHKKPSRFADSHKPFTLELPLDPGSGATFLQALLRLRQPGQPLDGVAMGQVMCEVNRSLVTDHAESYRKFFDFLLSRQPTPMVMHCASGKDRTGVAAALLLSALGVERNVVIADYLLTNHCLDVNHHVARAISEYNAQYADFIAPEALTAMFGVRQEYIESALDEIDSRFGGMTFYLREQMGLDDMRLKQLQHHYLEP